MNFACTDVGIDSTYKTLISFIKNIWDLCKHLNKISLICTQYRAVHQTQMLWAMYNCLHEMNSLHKLLSKVPSNSSASRFLQAFKMIYACIVIHIRALGILNSLKLKHPMGSNTMLNA